MLGFDWHVLRLSDLLYWLFRIVDFLLMMTREEIRTRTEKRCNVCKRILPLDNFRKRRLAADGHDYTCSECKAKAEHERYMKRHPRLIQDASGRAVIRENRSRSIYWSPDTIKNFIRRFPNEPNDDLVIDFNCSESTLIRRAHKYGVCKSPEFMEKHRYRHLKTAQIIAWNRPRSEKQKEAFAKFQEANKPYRFKKKVVTQ